MYAFPTRFMVWMMYAFLNRPFKTAHKIRYIKNTKVKKSEQKWAKVKWALEYWNKVVKEPFHLSVPTFDSIS